MGLTEKGLITLFPPSLHTQGIICVRNQEVWSGEWVKHCSVKVPRMKADPNYIKLQQIRTFRQLPSCGHTSLSCDCSLLHTQSLPLHLWQFSKYSHLPCFRQEREWWLARGPSLIGKGKQDNGKRWLATTPFHAYLSAARSVSILVVQPNRTQHPHHQEWRVQTPLNCVETTANNTSTLLTSTYLYTGWTAATISTHLVQVIHKHLTHFINRYCRINGTFKS